MLIEEPPAGTNMATRADGSNERRLGRLGSPAGLYVPTVMLGQNIQGLFDTGATCTVVSIRVWDRIPENQKPGLDEPRVRLATIGDHDILNRGSCMVELRVDGRPITCPVQVCDITEEAVLGLDVLSVLKVYWDWDGEVLRDCPGQGKAGLDGDQVGPLRELPETSSNQIGPSDALSEPDAPSMEVHTEESWEMSGPMVAWDGSYPTEVAWDDMAEEMHCAIRETASDSSEPPVSGSAGGAVVGPVVGHLLQLYEATSAGLDQARRPEFASLLNKFSHVFSKNDQDIGRTDLEVHRIPTGNARPIRLAPRRAPMHLRADIEAQVESMLAQGIVEECASPWAAPLVVVKKKDGSNRICVDYRALNKVTEMDGHPIPRIADSLDALAGATVFSTLDMTSGYHQVEVAAQDRDKTAFVTGRGHHLRFVTMPFGLCGAPSTFQRLMERVLQGLVWKSTVVYLDDVVIFSRTPEEHVGHLREVLERFEAHNLKLKPRKCELFRSEVGYLGHVVSRAGVATDPGNIEKVKSWEPPRNQKEVRSFLGLTGYYRSYVKDYGEIAEPMVRLTDARTEFRWTPQCQRAFETLRERLVTAPILGYPNQQDMFVLDTDASDVAIGAVLSQRQGGHERVIAYGSKALNQAERNYCVTRRELLAVVHFVDAYRYYLYGRPFLLRTDHSSLRWMLDQKEPRDQLARWIQRLSTYQFTIEHRAGKKHGNADGMSRKCFRGGNCFHPEGKEQPRSPEVDPSESDPKTHQGQACTKAGLSHREDMTHGRLESSQCRVPLETSEAHGEHCQDELGTIHALQGMEEEPNAGAAGATGSQSTGPEAAYQDSGAPDTGEPAEPQGLVVGLDLEDLIAQQRADPVLSILRTRLEAGLPCPEPEDISHLSPEVKRWYAKYGQLEIRQGILKYRWEPSRPGDPVTWKILTPQVLQDTVMAHVHDLKSAGHLGVARTWAKATMSPYIWAGMRADLARYVRRCQLCQQRKPPKAKKRAKMVLHQVGAPWERIAADVAGPFPVTKAGNKYILVIQDYFTKWVEVLAMPDQTAETVATLLVDQVLARFGCCRAFHSDQGSNFESQVMKEVSRLFGVKKTRTTSYHPRGDGMVERHNRTMEAMLSIWTNSQQDDWDQHLGLLAMAYRSAPHETTAETPNMMNLGREITLPVDLLLEAPPDQEPEDNMSQYAQRLQDKLRMAHEAARANMTSQMVSQKRHYDQSVRLVTYAEGDIVWLHSPVKKQGRSFKLTRPWTGPYLIVTKISDVTFRIQASPRSRPQIIHADRLKPCVGFTATDLGFSTSGTAGGQTEGPADPIDLPCLEPLPQRRRAPRRGRRRAGLADRKLRDTGNGPDPIPECPASPEGDISNGLVPSTDSSAERTDGQQPRGESSRSRYGRPLRPPRKFPLLE